MKHELTEQQCRNILIMAKQGMTDIELMVNLNDFHKKVELYRVCKNCYYSMEAEICARHTIYDEDTEPLGQLEITPNFGCNDFKENK